MTDATWLTIIAAGVPALINIGVVLAQVRGLRSDLLEAKVALATLADKFDVFRYDTTNRLTRVESVGLRTARAHDASR